MKRTESTATAIAIVLAALSTSAANAQSAAAGAPPAPEQASAIDPTGSTTDDIIVTAQKRSESVNDVPISIVAVSGAQLKTAGIVDIAGLTKVVPGFVVANTYFGSPVYYLRGVGFYDTAIAARPSVALYADEAPLTFPVMSKGSALDLERVEVLKGPQGLLFGSNATGGAINFVAAKPTRTLAAGAQLSYGRFNDVVVDGFVSGPLSDSTGVRLAVQRETMDDWQRGYTTDRTNGSKNITSGRATLETRPNNDFTLRFTASGTIDHSDTIAPQLIGKDLTLTQISPLFTAYPLNPGDIRSADVSTTFPDGKSTRRDDWTYQLTVRADYEATPGLTLTSLTSFTKAHQDYGYEADGTTLNVTNLGIEGNVKTLFQELRASGSTGGLNFILGANYQRDKSDELVTFLLPDGRSGRVFLPLLGLPAIDLVPEIARQTTNAYAGYLSGDYALTRNLTFRAGVRYTETKTDFAACVLAGGNRQYAIGISRILGTAAPALGQCATFSQDPVTRVYSAGLVTNRIDEDNISWRVGLDLKPTSGTLLYASASRGYKAGAFSNISAVFATQYVPVPQESLIAYEVGVKADLVPRVLHVNAAAFYYDYAKKQLLGTVIVPVFNRLNALVSVPKSRVQGFEADVDLRPVGGLSLRASATYVDSKVTSSFNNFTVYGVAADFQGSEFPNTPRWQANGSIDYRTAISGTLDAFLGGSVTYRGTSNSDFIKDDRLTVPAYTLFDAIAGVESHDGRWRLQLWGRNLTDKLNYSTIVVRQEARVRTVGLPRTFGITAGFRY